VSITVTWWRGLYDSTAQYSAAIGNVVGMFVPITKLCNIKYSQYLAKDQLAKILAEKSVVY
jgi:hypothetical protein